VVYEGAGHGFMRAGETPDASAPNKKARDEAWKRVKEALRKIWRGRRGHHSASICFHIPGFQFLVRQRVIGLAREHPAKTLSSLLLSDK